MFAVFKTGGKQYRVQKGDVLSVEKLDLESGATAYLGDVLLVGDEKSQTVGTPTVDDAAVEVKVVEQKRDRKVIIFKKKRRHTYRRKKGHRQHKTVLEITDILAKGGKSKVGTSTAPAKKAPAKADAKAKAPAKAKAEATEKKAPAKKAPAKKAVAKKTTKKATAKKAAAKKS